MYIEINEPVSRAYSLLKDMNGVIGMVISTDEKPWSEFFDEWLKNVYDEAYSKLADLDKETLASKMFVAYKHVHAERLNFKEPDVILEEDEGIVLMKKLVQVEEIVIDFLQLYFFYNFLKKKDQTFVSSIGEYIRLFQFVSKHTSGTIHVIAKNLVMTYSYTDITQLARGKVCPVCCSHGHNSHLCITKKCGHTFHLTCYLQVQSPECPCCRSIE